MRKVLTALVVIIGVVVILRQLLPRSGGGGGDVPIADAPYYVTRQTGVYLATGGDDPAYLLEAGMLLRPVGGASTLDCRPVLIAGETASVCHVEVVLSGRWGWVAEEDIAAR
jgi:hypothetical protein